MKGNADSCSYTDANGRAAVEVLNSDPETINVIADFDPEGLLRSIDVDIPGPPASGDLKGSADQDADQPVLGPTVAGPAGRPGVDRVGRIWIQTARLVKKGGKVRLVVKIKSDLAKHAKLRAKVLGKKGRKLGSWTKKVRTNQKVKLRVSRKARAARVVSRPLGERGFSQRSGGPLRRALGASGLVQPTGSSCSASPRAPISEPREWSSSLR